MMGKSNSKLSPRRQASRRWIGRIAVGSAAVASLAGVLAFRTLFDRPGEAALRLVPADAVLVASVDLSASPGQVGAFKQIDDALADKDLSGIVQNSLIDLFEPEAKGREALRPLVLRHGAMAMLPRDGEIKEGVAPLMVALLAVSSGPETQRALAKEGLPRYFRGAKYYKLRHGNSFYMVVDDVLVVATEPEAMLAVKQVREGGANILSQADFVAARRSIAEDSNLMVFVSPKIADAASEATKGVMAGWAAFGLAIREGGIGMGVAGALNPTKEPAIAAVAKVAPIRDDLFRILPSGMYGAAVVSQPSEYAEAFESVAEKEEEMKGAVDEMQTSMRKELGVDYKADVLPAMRGNTMIAFYPAEASVSGIDVLWVMDDRNEADPANALKRLIAGIEDQNAKEGGPSEFFVERTEDGVEYGRLTQEAEEGLREGLQPEGDEAGPFKSNPLGGNKTIAYAFVGKTAIAASSQELLDRAVASYRTHQASLVDDPDFASIRNDVVAGNQQVVMWSLSRVAKGIRNTLDEKKMKREDKEFWDSMLGMFSTLETPMTSTFRMTPDGRFAGGSFLPVNYGATIDFITKMTEGEETAPRVKR
jgi:hypothetical protein